MKKEKENTSVDGDNGISLVELDSMKNERDYNINIVDGGGDCDGGGGGGNKDEIHNLKQDNDLLFIEGAGDHPSSFYSLDFPPLVADCMSSSSSTTSTPVPANPVVIKISSSSSSSLNIIKPEGVEKDIHFNQDHLHAAAEVQDGYNFGAAPRIGGTLSSTASMEDGGFLNFDGMVDCNMENSQSPEDLIDVNNEIRHPSSIFQVEKSARKEDNRTYLPPSPPPTPTDPLPSLNQTNEEDAEKPVEEYLNQVVNEWLKENSEYITVNDLKNITLNKCTIESASKNIGNTKEGKIRLLKLILQWVAENQITKVRTPQQSIMAAAGASAPHPFTSSPWIPSQQPYGAAFTPDPYNILSHPAMLTNQYYQQQPWQPQVTVTDQYYQQQTWQPQLPVTNQYYQQPTWQTPAMVTNQYYQQQPWQPPVTVTDQYYQQHPWQLQPPAPVTNQYYLQPTWQSPAMMTNQYYQQQSWQPPVTVTDQYYQQQTWQPPATVTDQYYQQQTWQVPAPVQFVPENNGSVAANLDGYYRGNPQVYPYYPGSSKEARQRRMARQRRRVFSHQYNRQPNRHINIHRNKPMTQIQNPVVDQRVILTNPFPNVAPTDIVPANWNGSDSPPPPPLTAAEQKKPMDTEGVMQGQRLLSQRRLQGWKYEKNLKFVLQKILKQSDVCRLGRIVLPKREVENYLPKLESRTGIPIVMEDMATSRLWHMRYRFWPNNKSRMYLLENTGEFVRANGLQQGDMIMVYTDVKRSKYLIRGAKMRQSDHRPVPKKKVTRRRRNHRSVSAAATEAALQKY